MIASLAATVIGWGVPAKFAKPFIFIMGLALAAALFFGAKALYDQAVISKHDAKVEASQQKADRKADEKASTQRRKDDARLDKERQELNDVKAIPDPAERKRAYYRCIELQRKARQNGIEPPACV